MGWNRYDTLTSVNAMNDLYKNELRLFMNLFLPSMKLIVKERVGSRRKRKYDDPKTPLDRVIESDKGQPHKIEQLKTLRKQLDPFRLSAAIEKKLEAIAKKANHRQSPKSIPAAETGQNSELNCIEASVMREISQILSLEVQYA